MRYVVLDTDVASRSIRRRLDGPLATKLTGTAWCVTFVTVGELWQWASIRSWGPRTREELQRWLDRVLVLDSDDAVARIWGRISAEARKPRTTPARQRLLDRGVLLGARATARDLEHQGLHRLHGTRGPDARHAMMPAA